MNRAFSTTDRWSRLLFPFILILAGGLVYYNSFSGVFLFDDGFRITQNPKIKQLWPVGELLVGSDRPLVNVSLAVNYALGGFQPWGYHAFNLAVHLAAGLTLYGVVRRMSLRSGSESGAARIGFCVALLWLVHPLQTESVTYVIQRAESMMGLLYLLTLYCFIRGISSEKRRDWLLGSVVACGLGMATKPIMVTAPLMVLLYDKIFITQSFRRTWRERRGYYGALAATWGIMGVLMATSKSDWGETVGLGIQMSPWQYALTETGVIFHYVKLAVWPIGLCLDYYDWPVETSLGKAGYLFFSGLFFVGMTGWGIWHNRDWGYWGAWFFIILAPTSSFVPVADVAFEHRMYLSLAAVVALVVMGGQHLLTRGVPNPDLRRWLAVGSIGLIALGYGWLTLQRNEDYRSAVAMWVDVVQKRPQNARGHDNLGVLLLDLERGDEAIVHFQTAIQLQPYYPQANYNLAQAYEKKGNIDSAVKYYSEAVKQNPNYADAYYNLALLLEKQSKRSEAAQAYQQVNRIHPGDILARYNYANLLVVQGKLSEAAEEYFVLLRLKPDFAQAHNNLGSVFLAGGKPELAQAQFEEALRLKPDLADARANQAMALFLLGKRADAEEKTQQAISLAKGAGNNQFAQEIQDRWVQFKAQRIQDVEKPMGK